MADTKYRIAAGASRAFALLYHRKAARADAGGLSFWLPGAFGSLAAAPGMPGWSSATIYLHLQSTGGRGANFVLPGGGRGAVAVGLTDHADVQGITYTSPVLGGQRDIETENRPRGWGTWATFSIAPAAPEPLPAATPTCHK